MEYRLSYQPQKAVDSGPELANVAEGLGAVFKQIHAVDAVAEAQDQTAGDNGRNQRCKDFRQCGYDPLQYVLILLGGLLDRILGHALYACCRCEVVVKICYGIADDDLELA